MKAAQLFKPAIWSYALQRICTWYPMRRLLSTLLVASRPRYPGLLTLDGIRLRDELRRDGVAFLPNFLGQDAIDRIVAHLDGARLRERFPPCRQDFTIERVPQNVHVAEYSTDHIVGCPDVLAIANHPRLLETAASYLGCRPTISNITIWWSLPADGTAQEAENYHRDVDDWRFVKFFAYLTDVDTADGAHCFVKGSHRSWRFLRRRRIPDWEIEKAFAAAERLEISGRRGDAFLEDTFGLHKGKPPTRRRRLLYQVEYSVGPIAVYTYNPRDWQGHAAQYDPYINRLYVRQ